MASEKNRIKKSIQASPQGGPWLKLLAGAALIGGVGYLIYQQMTSDNGQLQTDKSDEQDTMKNEMLQENWKEESKEESDEENSKNETNDNKKDQSEDQSSELFGGDGDQSSEYKKENENMNENENENENENINNNTNEEVVEVAGDSNENEKEKEKEKEEDSGVVSNIGTREDKKEEDSSKVVMTTTDQNNTNIENTIKQTTETTESKATKVEKKEVEPEVEKEKSVEKANESVKEPVKEAPKEDPKEILKKETKKSIDKETINNMSSRKSASVQKFEHDSLRYTQIKKTVDSLSSYTYKNGELKVIVHRGIDLPKLDKNGTQASDPYVKIEVSHNKTKKTKYIENSENPIWNESFTFRINDTLRDTIIFEVMDKDKFSTNDQIGNVIMPIINVCHGNGVLIDQIFSLQNPKIKKPGKIQVSFFYTEPHNQKKK